LAEATAEVREMLASTGLAGALIVPVSSVTGQGIDRLEAHLAEARAALPSARVDGHFRLAVDRSFSLAGIGTVVTGTAVAGSVAVGDRLLVTPNGKPVRVRGLHAENREAASGQAGQRLALNLAGVEKQDIARGDWIVAEAAHAPTQRLDARLRVLASEARPLAHWTPVHLHLGALDVGARVVLLEAGDRAGRKCAGAARTRQAESARCTATDSSCATSRHCARSAAHGDRRLRAGRAAPQVAAPGRAGGLGTAHARRSAGGAARTRAAQRGRPAALLDAVETCARIPRWPSRRPCRTAPSATARPRWPLPGPDRDLGIASGRAAVGPPQARADSPGMTVEQLQRSATAKAPVKPSAAVFALLLRELSGSGGTLQRHGPYLRLAGHEASLQGADQKLWSACARGWPKVAGTTLPSCPTCWPATACCTARR